MRQKIPRVAHPLLRAAAVRNYDKGFMSFSALPPRKKRNAAHASGRTMEARGSMQQHGRELSRNKAVCFAGDVLEIPASQRTVIFPLIKGSVHDKR